jgi:hypothetical protein
MTKMQHIDFKAQRAGTGAGREGQNKGQGVLGALLKVEGNKQKERSFLLFSTCYLLLFVPL